MWPIIWAATRTYAPYITLPVAFVVGAVGYHLERFIRGGPQQTADEKSILEMREERTLQEVVGSDPTKVISLKERLEFKPKAVLYGNSQEKN